MRLMSLLSAIVVLPSLFVANSQQVPVYPATNQVYPATAGAYPQQTLPQQQATNQAGQVVAQPQAQTGMTSLAGNVPPQKQENQFLEYYSRQGAEFSASVYYQDGTKLAKRDISADDLRKAIVVFFGDWCPHCNKFLTEFSKHVEMLRMYGINIIFLNVPSIDRLKNWQEPNVDEFNTAENKISSYGIKLSKKVSVVMLGDRASLAKSGVEGLPVIIAIKNGREYYRGIGETAISKLVLSDRATLENFLEIWDEETSLDEQENVNEDNKQATRTDKAKPQSRKASKRNKKNGYTPTKFGRKSHYTGVNLKEAKKATALLNKYEKTSVDDASDTDDADKNTSTPLKKTEKNADVNNSEHKHNGQCKRKRIYGGCTCGCSNTNDGSCKRKRVYGGCTCGCS